MAKDQNADTQIQPAIAHRVGMISNQHTHHQLVPIEKTATMKQQLSLTKWEESLPIAISPLEDVGR